MHENEDPREHHEQEFQETHYHDDDEDVPVDDITPHGPRPPAKKRTPPPRRMPRPRRRFEED